MFLFSELFVLQELSVLQRRGTLQSSPIGITLQDLNQDFPETYNTAQNIFVNDLSIVFLESVITLF